MVKRNSRSNVKLSSLIDKVAYTAGILGVLIYIPQIIKVWVNDDISGLSLTTWTGFVVGALIWLSYGIVHKQKVIIFANILLVITQLIVVAGIYFKS